MEKYLSLTSHPLPVISHVTAPIAAPWTVTHQAALPMEFSRQEYWSRLPFPTPGHLPNPGIEHESRVSCIEGIFFTMSSTWEAPWRWCVCVCVCVHSVAPLCPTFCDPMDCSLPGCSAHGIFQARRLKWGAISYSRASSQPRD